MKFPDEKAIENYLGIDLVARFYEGEYQGKAWGRKSGQSLAHVKGKSIQDVLQQLREAVDSPELKEEFRQGLIRKHGEFLKKKGVDLNRASVDAIQYTYASKHRVTHCYNCASGLDNEIDIECPQCSWIICTGCGACGCGHPEYGSQFSKPMPSKKDPGRTRGGDFFFADFEEAKEFAKKNPGAKLSRQTDGAKWKVRL